MQILKDFDNVFYAFVLVLDKAHQLVASGNYPELMAFIEEALVVIQSFANVLSPLSTKIPDITPFPKNFFSQLSWLTENEHIIASISAVNLEDPFKDARQTYDTFAQKWELGLGKL